ncbi:MAG: hypothetical protein GKR77_04970 [Legionellales bacterium]|nr:hypothetical protein [Legionellales bacterium]
MALDPKIIAKLKKDLATYQASGNYDKDLAKITLEATNYIDETAEDNVKKSQPKKLAIVLDIDDTSLSNYDFLLSKSFCSDKNSFDKYISGAKDPVLTPTLNLYKDALSHNVAVFFITGRPESLKQATIKNLKNKNNRIITLERFVA